MYLSAISKRNSKIEEVPSNIHSASSFGKHATLAKVADTVDTVRVYRHCEVCTSSGVTTNPNEAATREKKQLTFGQADKQR